MILKQRMFFICDETIFFDRCPFRFLLLNGTPWLSTPSAAVDTECNL